MITVLFIGLSSRISRSLKYRMGVGRVSQGIEFDTYIGMIIKKLRQKYTNMSTIRQKFDTFDTCAIPLRRGGFRIYYSYIPMLIGQFQGFATPLNFFLFLAQQKNKLSFRCRKSKNNYA